MEIPNFGWGPISLLLETFVLKVGMSNDEYDELQSWCDSVLDVGSSSPSQNGHWSDENGACGICGCCQ